MTASAASKNLTVIGPNLSSAQQQLGQFHVHAAGCADIARKYQGARIGTASFASVQEIVESVYEDMIGESDPDETWGDYASEFHFAPCCKTHELPRDTPDDEVETTTEALATLAAAAALVIEHGYTALEAVEHATRTR